MTKLEVMQMLEEKRKIVAPVDLAEQNFNQARNTYHYRKEKFKMPLIIFGVLGLLSASGGGGVVLPIIVAIVAVAKHFLFVKPAEEAMLSAQTLYNEEASNPDYIKGQEGFPAQFYNYTALYRLHKLLQENRADDLKEAFNLLENQQYNESQLSLQEEMRALQQDTASSAKVAAIASSITAFNTWRK